jgi:hypothetical protein
VGGCQVGVERGVVRGCKRGMFVCNEGTRLLEALGVRVRSTCGRNSAPGWSCRRARSTTTGKTGLSAVTARSCRTVKKCHMSTKLVGTVLLKVNCGEPWATIDAAAGRARPGLTEIPVIRFLALLMGSDPLAVHESAQSIRTDLPLDLMMPTGCAPCLGTLPHVAAAIR